MAVGGAAKRKHAPTPMMTDDPNEVDNVDEQQDVRAGGGSAGVCNENNQSRLRGIKCAGLLCWFYT